MREETQLSLNEWQSLLEMTSKLFSRTNESLGVGPRQRNWKGFPGKGSEIRGDISTSDRHTVTFSLFSLTPSPTWLHTLTASCFYGSHVLLHGLSAVSSCLAAQSSPSPALHPPCTLTGSCHSASAPQSLRSASLLHQC